MRDSHSLSGIGDQVSRNKRVFHADMSHCDAVTDCYCREKDRRTACSAHSCLYRLGYLIEVHMARHYFVI